MNGQGIDERQKLDMRMGTMTLEKRAVWVTWLLRATLLLMAVHCFLAWLRLENGRSGAGDGILGDNYLAIIIVELILFVVTGIFFLRWKHQANLNLQNACSSPLVFSPGWSWGLYFVPLLNLFRPMQAMYEIQSRSKAGIGYMVWIWWLCLMIAALINRAMMNARSVKFDRLCVTDMIAVTLSMIAGIFLLRIIKVVTEKQRRYRLAVAPEKPTSSKNSNQRIQ